MEQTERDIQSGDEADYELKLSRINESESFPKGTWLYQSPISGRMIPVSSETVQETIKERVASLTNQLEELLNIVDGERDRVKSCLHNAADHETFQHLLQAGRRIKVAQEEMRKASFESDRL